MSSYTVYLETFSTMHGFFRIVNDILQHLNTLFYFTTFILFLFDTKQHTQHRPRFHVAGNKIRKVNNLQLGSGDHLQVRRTCFKGRDFHSGSESHHSHTRNKQIAQDRTIV